MIILTTGTPGSGKTLYTLHQVKTRIEAENKALEAKGEPVREIYYSGINDLRLPWIELDDATKWNSVPAGSVIVIDECQRVFRPRGVGMNVPPYIADLETHRHKGYDIYLITQHPMLCDQNIRRLVGQHQHIVRKFGISAATVHEWGSTHEITQRNLLSAVRRTWPYSKEVFGYYKSAEMHTHKAKLPKRVWFLLASPVLLAAFVWFAYTKLNGVGKADPVTQQSPAVASAPVADPVKVKALAAAEEKLAYFERQLPRVPAYLHTAPKYDEITRPVDAPYPSACLISKGFDTAKGEYYEKCGCIDQRGNRYRTDEATCKRVAIDGFFRDWGQPEADMREHQAKSEPATQSPRQPDAGAADLDGDGPFFVTRG